MPVKQVPGGKWKVVKKDGKLGKTAFSTKSAAQSRARGPGKKAKGRKVAKRPAAKKPAKRRSSSTSATSSFSRIGTGRSYQAGRATALILAPASHEVLAVVTEGKPPAQAGRDLFDRVKSRPMLTHEAIVAADIIVDRSRKVGQAAALSRGSVTAWLPEGYLLGSGVMDVLVDKLGARDVHTRYIQRQTGWSPVSNTWNPQRARIYRIAKHGGQAVRILSGRVKILTRAKRMLQETILRPMGATL